MKILLLFLFVSVNVLFSQEEIIKTVDSVDLKKYAGKWYENPGEGRSSFASVCFTGLV